MSPFMFITFMLGIVPTLDYIRKDLKGYRNLVLSALFCRRTKAKGYKAYSPEYLMVSKAMTLNSALLTRVFFAVSTNTPAYPTKIAAALGVRHSATINEYLRFLEKSGLVFRGKLSKPQIYFVNWTGAARLWEKLWLENFGTLLDKQNTKPTPDLQVIIKQIAKNPYFPELLKIFFSYYVQQKRYGLRDLFLGEFQRALRHFAFPDKYDIEMQVIRISEAQRNLTLGDVINLQKNLIRLYGAVQAAEIPASGVANQWHLKIRELSGVKE